MPTKLKNLKVTKVDFVDEGANPDAHIQLYKRREETPGTPAPAPGGKQGAGEAAAEPEKSTKLWGKVFGAIAKAFNTSDTMEGAVEEIQKKDGETFGQTIERRKLSRIADEIWDLCNALERSLSSILYDEDSDQAGKEAAMKISLEEFNSVVNGAVSKWCGGQQMELVTKGDDLTAVEIGITKRARDRLDEIIRKADGEGKDDPDDGEKEPDSKDEKAGKNSNSTTITKGETEGMRIDKSKLTDEDRAILETLEKRYGEADPEGEAPAGTGATVVTETAQGDVAKGKAPAAGATPATAAAPVPAGNTQAPDTAEDVWKGVHPAVRAEFEALKKFRQEVEDREILEVAKKYEIIGKKADELAPVLKSLKAAGGNAYDQMISVLDASVDMVTKSGLFTEIGKSGHGDSTGGSWAEAEKRAQDIMKSRAGITKAQALDEVLMADPELAAKCEKEE